MLKNSNPLILISISRVEKTFECNLLELNIKKGIIKVVRKIESIHIDSISSHITKGQSIYLYFEDNVINKKLDKSNPQHNIWFEKINSDSVYYNFLKQDVEYYSLVDKNYIDQIIKNYFKGIQIVSFYLGPFINKIYFDLFKMENIKTGFTSVNFVNTSNYSIIKDSEHLIYNIQEEKIDSKFISLYAIGLTTFLQIDTIHRNYNTSKNNKTFDFNKIFIYIVFLLFVTIITSLCVNTYLNNKISKKRDEINIEKNELREELIKEYKYSNKNFHIYYYDEIFKNINEGIVLESVEIFPLKNKEFLKKVILIKGTCMNNLNLNEWIKILKAYKWISEINISNITTSKDGITSFVLEINRL